MGLLVRDVIWDFGGSMARYMYVFDSIRDAHPGAGERVQKTMDLFEHNGM